MKRNLRAKAVYIYSPSPLFCNTDTRREYGKIVLVSLMNKKVAFVHKMSQNNYNASKVKKKNPLTGDNWFVTIQTNSCHAKAILIFKSQCRAFGNVLKSFIPISAEI